MIRFSDLSAESQAFERAVFGKRSTLHSADNAVLWDDRLTNQEIILKIQKQRAERAVQREKNALLKAERAARVAARKATPVTRNLYPRRSFRALCDSDDVLRAAALGVKL